MGANTKIEWATHTFNPWIGCTEVSAACDFCYARTLAQRHGWAEWGNHPRHRTSAANWKLPLKWNRDTEFREVDEPRPRVFCASLADVFDNQVPTEWRTDLWRLIRETPNLDWLLLTKRPQNVVKMLPGPCAARPWPWPNVWLGTTVENQEEGDRRIPHLLAVPANVHFLSCEPLLGPIDLNRISLPGDGHRLGGHASALHRQFDGNFYEFDRQVGWVICGGESGSHWRPMQNEWALSLLRQCEGASVPFFMKQMSGVKPEKALDQFPADLRLRQFPVAA